MTAAYGNGGIAERRHVRPADDVAGDARAAAHLHGGALGQPRGERRLALVVSGGLGTGIGKVAAPHDDAQLLLVLGGAALADRGARVRGGGGLRWERQERVTDSAAGRTRTRLGSPLCGLWRLQMARCLLLLKVHPIPRL